MHLMDAHYEVGVYFQSRIPYDTPINEAKAIASAMEAEFSAYGVALEVAETPDGLSMAMAIKPDLLPHLVQEIRERQRKLTELL
jgi:hypothetical protein